MDWTEDRIRRELAGRTILIVEDDIDLALGVKQLLKAYGVKEKDVTIKRCVEGDTHGGLDILREKGWGFDLIVVDNMLPWNEVALRECDDLEEQWDRLQAQIGPLRGRKGVDAQLKRLRERLTIVSQRLRATIDRAAAIKMIKQWLAETPKPAAESSAGQPAILFLTARQEESLRSAFGECEIPWRWLTKPALQSQVLTAAAELFSEAGAEEGGR